jgi:hypothetical protein
MQNRKRLAREDGTLAGQLLRSARTYTHTRTGINRIASPHKGRWLAGRDEWPQIVLLILVVAGAKGNAAGQCCRRHAVGVQLCARGATGYG